MGFVIASDPILWNHYQQSVRGESKRGLNHLARRCGMDVIARRMLNAPGLRKRLLVAYTVGHLGDQEALPRLWALAGDENPVLSLAAARALMMIEPRGVLPDLMAQFARRQDWPLAGIAAILEEAGPDVVSPTLEQSLNRAASAGTTAELLRLLALTEVAESGYGRATIRRIFETSKDPEILSACLKAITDPRDVDLARGVVAHGQWVVRMKAAQVLAQHGDISDRPALERLLSDPVWWVRYRAAQALASLPSLDRNALLALRGALTDRFASNMLGQVLGELSIDRSRS